jgi:hypothetical protein
MSKKPHLLALTFLLLLLIIIVHPSVHALIYMVIGGTAAATAFTVWSNRYQLRYWIANNFLALAISTLMSYAGLSLHASSWTDIILLSKVGNHG